MLAKEGLNGEASGKVVAARLAQGTFMHSYSAGHNVLLEFAAGERPDKGEHVDFIYFWDASHGDEFSIQTCKDRQHSLQRKIMNPEDLVLGRGALS